MSQRESHPEKAGKTGAEAVEREDADNSDWQFVRQMRSDDAIYRKFSTIASQEVVERTNLSKFGQETLICEWSHDSNIFAWAVGTNLVSLHAVPQFLPVAGGVNQKAAASLSSPHDAAQSGAGGRRQSEFGVSEEDASRSGRMAQLDCGVTQRVTCMYFGSRVSDKKWHSGEVKYNRFEEQIKGQLVLATGLANGDIKIWEVASGKLIMVLQDHTDAVTDLKFSPDGSLVLVSASKDCTVKLWDLMDDGNMFRTLERQDNIQKPLPIKKVAWSPDATRLAAVGDGKMALVWEMKTYTVERRLQGHQNDVTGCKFSADGKWLFTSSFDTRVICWNVEDGSQVRKFEHMDPPPSNIFASGTNDHEVIGMDMGRNLLATICNDGLLRIWNTVSKEKDPLTDMDIVPDPRYVSFADNGKLLAVGCQGGIVQFFSNNTTHD